MGHYYPTSGYIYNRDEGEWELAKFLALNFTQSQMNQFLKLKWFKTQVKPSFKSADQLLGWMASLPHGPQWRRTTVEFKGYKSMHPIQLIWQDALEVVKDLFSNPIFTNFMTYDPHMVFQGLEREYSEFFTATHAFDIQVQLPQGATITPIIIASDKTPVTRHTGGLEMHPVFIMIGNIQSDVRMQASSHAWRCIAFMPVPVFEVHPDFQTILHAFFTSLYSNCFTPLVTYIADLPKQQLVACAWNIPSFQKAAKAEKLLGMHHPFWRDWKFADPAHFLVGEILHTCCKFFFDHIQHKHVGIRHFASGISHVKQMMGRDHRDIERTIIPMLDGTIPPLFIYAVCSMVEFIYRAQQPIHTNLSIASMTATLQAFHTTKHSILDAGAQRGAKGSMDNFNIPKLELMHTFACHIKENGTLIQYTANLLNHKETIHSFDLYILLCSLDLALDTAIMVKNEEVTSVDLALSSINHVLLEKETMFQRPWPFQNHFNDPKCFSLSSGAFAFHVTVTYELPDLPQVISDYISAALCGSQAVQAFPPSDSHPLGNCDAVLLKHVNDDVNFDVAQVQAIFMLKTKKELPVYLGPIPLIYVCYFHIVWLPEQNGRVRLYRVQHIPPSSTGASGIIPLTNVIHAVELVPVYNTRTSHATIDDAGAVTRRQTLRTVVPAAEGEPLWLGGRSKICSSHAPPPANFSE
ncbi:hypothetical protein F5J12DRAFT_905461 [Pisolithus orientalis]|uniref:uncharacterized protein n=1 Tax=Pisolithus orientalis TaxID=936130 RepID=UPI00222466D9|nr:uncharacterized protein F5J12DRAFT_905461 [Pisolithus orientalis]KAI6007529.1 hypothetical protein F5J12DRAFT_905461 [Pisolithus orientalis]